MRHVLKAPRFAAAAAAAAAVLAVAAACAVRDPLPAASPPPVPATGPDSFVVQFRTTKGDFTLLARRHWSPVGVDRLHHLVGRGFYDDARFFRVVQDFVVQFGIPAGPAAAAEWTARTIPDEPVRASNRRGTVSFARGSPASRTTQLFINLRDNVRLDTLGGFGFPPIGEIVDGMNVVTELYGGYGEAAPRGQGPAQDSIRLQGNAYLDRRFPRLDAIRTARITESWK